MTPIIRCRRGSLTGGPAGSEPTASLTPAEEPDDRDHENENDDFACWPLLHHFAPGQFFFPHVHGSRPPPALSVASVAPSPARRPKMSSPIVYPGGRATPQAVATMNGSSPGSTPGYCIIW